MTTSSRTPVCDVLNALAVVFLVQTLFLRPCESLVRGAGDHKSGPASETDDDPFLHLLQKDGVNDHPVGSHEAVKPISPTELSLAEPEGLEPSKVERIRRLFRSKGEKLHALRPMGAPVKKNVVRTKLTEQKKSADQKAMEHSLRANVKASEPIHLSIHYNQGKYNTTLHAPITVAQDPDDYKPTLTVNLGKLPAEQEAELVAVCAFCAHGSCVSGVCVCHPGWVGDDCNVGTGNTPETSGDIDVAAGPGGKVTLPGVQDCPSWCVLPKGTCHSGAFGAAICECEKGLAGPHCEHVVTDGQTVYVPTVAQCPNCTINADCGAGKWGNPVCVCHHGWRGPLCDIMDKPAEVSEGGTVCAYCVNGVCNNNGTCACYTGWNGTDCDALSGDVAACAGNCHGRGDCTEGICECNSPYTGDSCEVGVCKNNCTQHGFCTKGYCQCSKGWGGDECQYALVTCGNNCGGNGRCYLGKCECFEEFSGELCENRKCPKDCSGHGECSPSGQCTCGDGWGMGDCSQPKCPNDCSNKGRCIAGGVCICNEGWQGQDCATLHQSEDEQVQEVTTEAGVCSGNGQFDSSSGICSCNEGFTGPACTVVTCTAECNGNGICDMEAKPAPTCQCNDGYEPPFCATYDRGFGCPLLCHGHGSCESAACVCDEDYGPPSCEYRLCNPADCSGHGTCQNGTCNCQQGWGTVKCDVQVCPDNCNDHGNCTDGVCQCETGYAGASCAVNVCKDDCNGHGQCANNMCICDDGFKGLWCEFLWTDTIPELAYVHLNITIKPYGAVSATTESGNIFPNVTSIADTTVPPPPED